MALKRAGLALLAAAYAAALWTLTRDVQWESYDGMVSLTNALVAGGQAPPGAALTHTRPLLSWLVLVPAVIAGGQTPDLRAALMAAHSIMSLLAATAVAAAYLLLRGLFPAPLAAGLSLLMAANPLLLRYAPFMLFDAASALPVLLFLAAGWKHQRTPGAASFALMLGAYVLAVMSRYQLGLLAMVPGLYQALAPGAGGLGRRLRKAVLSPGWLLPPLAYGLIVVILGLVSRTITPDPVGRCIAGAHAELLNVVAINMNKESPRSFFYIASAARHLGVLPATLAGIGLLQWLAGSDAPRRFLALGAVLPLAILSLAIGNQEQRYLLSFLPILYATLGQGVVWAAGMAGGSRKALIAAAALTAAAAPWPASLAAGRFLRSEPTLRSPAANHLGRWLQEQLPPGGCAVWAGGDLVLRPTQPDVAGQEQMPMLNSLVMRVYARRLVLENSDRAAHGCATVLVAAAADPPAPGPGDREFRVEAYAADPGGAPIPGTALRGVRRWTVTAAGASPAAAP